MRNIPSGERRDVEQEDFLGLLRGISRENGGLDSGTVGHSLVGVDRLVGLLAIEEVGDELDDLGNTSRTTDEDNFVHVGLVDL
jgi:hypothetical protein